MRREHVSLSWALGTVLTALIALVGVSQQARAASTEKIVFASNRTTGKVISLFGYNEGR